MKRLFIIVIALIATGAHACAPDDYLCQGGEKMRQLGRDTYSDNQRVYDAMRQGSEATERYIDARERAASQTFTDSLIMRLDRR